jgi:hypothetical protein
MKPTLEVFNDNKLIFYSDAKWLHPLFELEKFLSTNNYEPANLIVKDKIVGRAAALLQVYLGIRTIKAGIMSEIGREVLEKFEVKYEYEKLVDQIQCRTEEMLKDEYDPEKAYKTLKELAGK